MHSQLAPRDLDKGHSLVGRQVMGVINIGTRKVAGFTSECLVLGACATPEDVVLLAVERPVANGTRIG